MKNLNKNIKIVWLIYNSIIFIIVYIILFLIKIYIFKKMNFNYNLYKLIFIIVGILYILTTIFMLKINYFRYKYLIKKDKIEISYGIFFKKSIIISFKKVQHIILTQNCITKIFGLTNVRIFTANKSYLIMGLTKEEILKIFINMKISD